MRRGKAWVKVSAPHRVCRNPDDAAPFARALIAANPDRVVWGTDWPHPGMGPRTPDVIQPFDGIDDARALERLHGWVRSPAVLEKILADNPAQLYDF